MQIQNVRNNQQNQTFGAIQLKSTPKQSVMKITELMAQVAEMAGTTMKLGLDEDRLCLNFMTKHNSEAEKALFKDFLPMGESLELKTLSNEEAEKSVQNFIKKGN